MPRSYCYRIAVCIITMLLAACGTTTPAHQADTSPSSAQIDGTASEDHQIRQMQQRMHQRHQQILTQYERLDEAYILLQEQEELSIELEGRLSEMRRIYSEIRQRHQMMQQFPQQDDMTAESTMHERTMRPMIEYHQRLHVLHQEMAEVNRDAGRESLAQMHESIDEHHQEMIQMCDQMMRPHQ